MNNNMIIIDENGESKKLLSIPKYQSNLNFQCEKLIEELKSSNQILLTELNVSREKVKDFVNQNSLLKKNENVLKTELDNLKGKIQNLNETVKK